MCPERPRLFSSQSATWRLAALSPAHRVGVRGPIPLGTGWRGGARVRGALLPLQASPLSHCTCHTTEGFKGTPAPSAWRGRQPGRAWVGGASPPVFLPDIPCRAARPAQCSPSLASQPGAPCTGAPLLASWTPSLAVSCLQGGGHFASQPRECAHRKRAAGHSARRKSQSDAGFCSFTDSGRELPICSIFNQSKSSLFSHKLRKAEMLMVTVGTVRGCFSAEGTVVWQQLWGAPR